MNIIYKSDKNITPEHLKDLFLSVGWASGSFPDKLCIAMKNSDTVFTAWHEDRLVGLVNALDDGVMTSYIHYLLVNPAYQSCGVGRKLLELIKDKYKDYLRIVLISYDDKIKFYQNCGFEIGADETPMFITSLSN
ncbi:MAG: GNAT family N-acetyltransferase [Eubacteriaceae bacterium]|nr:GNAT family N-acetyltransferase [Eubacteriaceae bacterium]